MHGLSVIKGINNDTHFQGKQLRGRGHNDHSVISSKDVTHWLVGAPADVSCVDAANVPDTNVKSYPFGAATPAVLKDGKYYLYNVVWK